MPDRPSANELERFLLGTLPPADAVRVAEWVTTAPEAAETLRALAAADTFTDSVKVVVRGDRAHLGTAAPGPDQTVTQLEAPTPSSAPVITAFPPAELGGFRIVRELGRGGMGAVFEATDAALGRKVALKVMLPEVAAHPQARARFLREARAAARVEHECIVPIYQVGEANGVPYIAMPLLAGESLDARLKAGNPLPLADILLIGRQMAEGLAAAHAGGLIHRDIKPSNIWLDLNPNGSVRRVRILDFGLARAPGDAVLTGAGDILGTPAYMSVEQARGQLVDFRTDLYSLGVVLYQAATGRRPFDGGTAYAVLALLAVHVPPAPVQVNPAVPPALSLLIVKMMSKTPAGRPQSARAIIEELARIAAPWRTAPVPAAVARPGHALPAVQPVQPPRPTPVPPPLPATDTVSVAAEPLSTLPDEPDPVPEPEPLSLDAEFSVEVDVTELFQPDPAPALPPPLPPRPRRGLLVAVGAVVVAGLLVAVVLAIRDGKDPQEQKPGDDNPPNGNQLNQEKGPLLEPVVIPSRRPVPSAERGNPNDPNRQLAEWLYARGEQQTVLVLEGDQWKARPLKPSEVRPGKPWVASVVYLTVNPDRPITEADLARFAHPSVEVYKFHLIGPGVTDETLDKFTRMSFMTVVSYLQLNGTSVTDSGLLFIARHKHIPTLSVGRSPVTQTGIDALAEVMPGTCSITWDKVTKKP